MSIQQKTAQDSFHETQQF